MNQPKKIHVHALHKSGSMFLYPFFKTVADLLKFQFYSINDTPKTEHLAFERNDDNDFVKSYIVSPLRWYPDQIETDINYIFVIRNPLDVLVSQYYSHGWIHPLPRDVPSAMDKFVDRRNDIQKLTVDEYVVKYSDELLQRYVNILSYWDCENVLVTGYSEMVCNFESWCNRVAHYCGCDKKQTKKLVALYSSEFNEVDELTPDQIKNGEKRHKRKMLPGDHLDKLSPDVIKVLNKKFDAVLKLIHTIDHTNAYETSFENEENTTTNTRDAVETPENQTDSIPVLKFGTRYGEWFVPDIFDNTSTFFCVGAGEDISFDILLQSYYDATVHIFDPTPRAMQHFILVEEVLNNEKTPPVNSRFGGGDVSYWDVVCTANPNLKKVLYHDYGISEFNATERRFFYPKNMQHVSCSIENIQNTTEAFSALTMTIKGALQETNVDHIDLLKLSTQGSEGKILLNMLESGVYPVVICVQWDGLLHGAETVETINDIYLRSLADNGYRLIYDNGRFKHTFLRVN